MTQHWIIVLTVAVAALALIVFLILRNLKDEKRVVQQMEDDYPKPKEHHFEDEQLE